MGKWADEFPEHSRTSCNDENRYNAHPSGKWCERCTALVMDDAQPPAVGVDVSDEMVERALNAWCDVAFVDDYRVRNSREAIHAALHAALRTGGGAA